MVAPNSGLGYLVECCLLIGNIEVWNGGARGIIRFSCMSVFSLTFIRHMSMPLPRIKFSLSSVYMSSIVLFLVVLIFWDWCFAFISVFFLLFLDFVSFHIIFLYIVVLTSLC